MPAFVYSPHLSYWRSLDQCRLNPLFLRQWARGPEFREQLDGLKHSTDMAPYLSLRDQRRLRISLPDSRTQCAIGNILGSLDDKIELNNQMNRTLEGIAQAVFKSRFIDFDGHDDLVDSELGPIPKGWTVRPLSNVASAIVDCLHSRKPAYQEDGSLMVQVFNIGPTGRMDWSKKYLVSEHDHKEWTRRIRPKKGDIFVSKTGRVGAFAQLLDDLDVSFGRNLVVIRPNPAVFPAPCLRVAMLSDSMTREISRMTSDGTVLRSIHVKHISKLRLVVPPIDRLRGAEQLLNPISERLLVNHQGSQTLAELRDALLPKLISGEIRVPEAENLIGRQT